MEFTDNVDGPFVRADIVREHELTTLQRITQPSPPSRVVPAKTEILIDEDGEEDEHVLEWRTLSDEEWRTALDAYERACIEWQRTQGRAHVRGPVTTRATFYTTNGRSVARAIYIDSAKRWHFTDWKTEHRR